jgi:hypothetical protein
MGLRLSTKEDLKCKHCGFVKERLDLYCYFAWNGGQWSDRRELAPTQAIPALVQYCPNCHRFYYIDAEGVYMTDVNHYNWIEPVEYEAILPSIREYDNFDWEPVIEYNQRCILLWAYNDKFYRNPSQEKPTEFDLRVAKWNLLNLTKFYEDPVMIAELLREAGMFDECLEVASEAEVSEEQNNILDKIIRLAQEQDNRPFKIE